MKNLKVRSMIFAIFVISFLETTQAIWDGEKWWFVEQKFSDDGASFQIDKSYAEGGITDY